MRRDPKAVDDDAPQAQAPADLHDLLRDQRVRRRPGEPGRARPSDAPDRRQQGFEHLFVRDRVLEEGVRHGPEIPRFRNGDAASGPRKESFELLADIFRHEDPVAFGGLERLDDLIGRGRHRKAHSLPLEDRRKHVLEKHLPGEQQDAGPRRRLFVGLLRFGRSGGPLLFFILEQVRKIDDVIP